MYGLKKIGKVLTSKSFGTGPSSYEKRIYRAAVSQRLRKTALNEVTEGWRKLHNEELKIHNSDQFCSCEMKQNSYGWDIQNAWEQWEICQNGWS